MSGRLVRSCFTKMHTVLQSNRSDNRQLKEILISVLNFIYT